MTRLRPRTWLVLAALFVAGPLLRTAAAQAVAPRVPTRAERLRTERTTFLDMFARAYFPGRSGQIMVVPREGEILTIGVVAGAVQIPPGGTPIVLLAEHQATGGYPVIATVISADLGLVAQRVPGERLRFVRVDRDRAVDALRGARAALEAIA